jgi:8-hydroxy-5-deazaflavin:NADPH oxidoreductase
VLDVAFPNSAGMLIQNWLPESHVVKAFNIIAAKTMCNPKMEEGTPDLFIAGNEKSAKDLVKNFAVTWGWNVQDIGEIGESYLIEALAMLWIRVAFNTNQWTHAFKILTK